MTIEVPIQKRMLPRPRSCNWSGRSVDRAVFRKVSRRIDPGLVEHEQGYRIRLAEDGVDIFAHDPAGMFYAGQTLEQIEVLSGHDVPCGEIDDWPDFKVRGYLLDICRDRVPSLSMLCSIIDKLASWKINQLQLYTEHTIAYRGHEAVWSKSSALTFDDLQVLERYCRDKYIDLVPLSEYVRTHAAMADSGWV